MQITQKDKKFIKFIVFFGFVHYTIPRHIYHSDNGYVVSDMQYKLKNEINKVVVLDRS